jgi:hypothetical protein
LALNGEDLKVPDGAVCGNGNGKSSKGGGARGGTARFGEAGSGTNSICFEERCREQAEVALEIGETERKVREKAGMGRVGGSVKDGGGVGGEVKDRG